MSPALPDDAPLFPEGISKEDRRWGRGRVFVQWKGDHGEFFMIDDEELTLAKFSAEFRLRASTDRVIIALLAPNGRPVAWQRLDRDPSAPTGWRIIPHDVWKAENEAMDAQRQNHA